MIFDLNETALPSTPRAFDVCIAGGGVAGITLARRLAARGRRVALLEGGGFDFTEQSQDIYKGPILGRPYFELDSARLRFLGGSSNHWGGRCRPLDPYDFGERPDIPHSGWPIGKADLDPYLEAACRIVEIAPDFADRSIVGAAGLFKEADFHFSAPVRFRDKYLAELKESRRIEVFLNANLVSIRLDEGTGRVAEFQCASHADRAARQGFAAKEFVLALGGIENPRLLLNCRDQAARGIGNGRDLVGRFFMEHVHAHCGYYVANEETWPFGAREVDIAPTKAFMDERRIANGGLRVEPVVTAPLLVAKAKYYLKEMVCADDIIYDFVTSIKGSFRCRARMPPVGHAGILRIACEQVPNPQSRVVLASETDSFGLRRAALDWQITDFERRTIRVMTTALARYLASHDFGNVKLEPWILGETPAPGADEEVRLIGGWHHMGTTRMARMPEDGVVDPDCRVFGHGNLYIAGSSVFPTGGHSNPTLTILQLTLRLSDHLDRKLAA